MPRAIAPLVTTTTSPPSRCRPARTSQTRASTSRRGSPSLPATTLEPSLTTTRLIGLSLGIQLECHTGDLDLIARLEALRLECLQHSDPPQPALHIGHR